MTPTEQLEASRKKAEAARQKAFQETLLSAKNTMVFSEILKLSMDSFRASKTRFALTALGMVIGTASVILVITIGLTGKQYIIEQLQKIEDVYKRQIVSVERRRRGFGSGSRAGSVLASLFQTKDEPEGHEGQDRKSVV